MRRRESIVNDWDILFFLDYRKEDIPVIMNALERAEATGRIMGNIEALMERGYPNEAFTFSNPFLRCTVVGIGFTDSGPEFMNSVIHEVVHVAQHISQTDGLDPFSEAFAYLSGDLADTISEVVCEMSCPHCNK